MNGPRPGFGTASGYVLAGGRSSRMGRDKARLPWGTATLIETVAATLAELTSAVTTVGGEPVEGLRHIPDAVSGFGPVSGIAAALRDAQTPWAIVVACDMPGLTAAFLKHLTENTGKHGCVPVTPDGRMHPLCAIWSADALPAFEDALARGEHTLRNVVAQLDVALTGVDDVAVLRNVNTPEEYAEALAGAGE